MKSTASLSKGVILICFFESNLLLGIYKGGGFFLDDVRVCMCVT